MVLRWARHCEKLTRGKKVSVLAWEHFAKMGSYEEKIIRLLDFRARRENKRS